jgi:hypothetical protein
VEEAARFRSWDATSSAHLAGKSPPVQTHARREGDMRRRRFIEIIAASGLVGCASPARNLPASSDFVVEGVAERAITVLPRSPMFWRIENFPTLQEARAPLLCRCHWQRRFLAACGSSRLVHAGDRTPGAAFTAEIGPLPRVEAVRYTLRLNHAHAPPGAATSVHPSGVRKRSTCLQANSVNERSTALRGSMPVRP